jgi:hypothetical protein
MEYFVALKSLKLMLTWACLSETSVPSARLHGATTQKTAIFIFAAVRTSNPTLGELWMRLSDFEKFALWKSRTTYFHTVNRFITSCRIPWNRDLLRRLASQEIPWILWGPKVHCRVHKSPLPEINPVHTPHPFSLRFVLILSSLHNVGVSSGLFPSGCPTKILYAFLIPPVALHASPIASFSIWSS